MTRARIATVNPRSFLSQTTVYGMEQGIFSRDKVDDVQEQIAAISHKLFVTRSRDLSSGEEARGSILSAFGTVSLGLEYASKGNIEESATILTHNDTILFFRIGNTLLKRLLRYAQKIREEAVLVSPTEMGGIVQLQERIEIYNVYERRFLDAIERGQLNIAAAPLTLESNSLPRPISSLRELSMGHKMLDQIQYRSDYLHTLPADRIFDAEFPPDARDDMAYLITRHLIVNIALYRQVDFHVTDEDLVNFFNICCDAADGKILKPHLDFVIGWIGHYLDLKQVESPVRRYAIEYWRECICTLEASSRELAHGDSENS